MIEFVTAGGMRLDTIITQQGQAHLELVGGNALYAAVGAALWQADVGLWARIGQNYPLDQLRLLAGEKIRLEGLIRLPGPQDHRTFFAYTADGRRDDTRPQAHFARINQLLPPALAGYVHSTPKQDDPREYEPLALRPADWPVAFAGVTAVHLSPLSLATHLQVPPACRQHGVQIITCDPGERYMIPDRLAYIKRLLPQIDAFLPSAMEIRSLFGSEGDLAAAALKLNGWGANIVVVKNGPAGVIICHQGKTTSLPAFHTKGDPRILDVTGAGDSFCGGFIVGLAQSDNPIEAARMGLISASLVIEGYGALYALSRQQAAESRLRAYTHPTT